MVGLLPRLEELHQVIHPVGADALLTTRGGTIAASYLAVAYAVTRGRDFAFFLVNLNASLLAVPSGIRDIWLYIYSSE